MTGKLKKMRSALSALPMTGLPPLQAVAEASGSAKNPEPVQMTEKRGEYTKCFIFESGTCMAISTKLPSINMMRMGIG